MKTNQSIQRKLNKYYTVLELLTSVENGRTSEVTHCFRLGWNHIQPGNSVEIVLTLPKEVELPDPMNLYDALELGGVELNSFTARSDGLTIGGKYPLVQRGFVN